jgi:lipopolysaccharide biosynthesis regulator YciM
MLYLPINHAEELVRRYQSTSKLGAVQNLGQLYHRCGKVDEAETMWKRALAGYEKGKSPRKQTIPGHTIYAKCTI